MRERERERGRRGDWMQGEDNSCCHKTITVLVILERLDSNLEGSRVSFWLLLLWLQFIRIHPKSVSCSTACNDLIGYIRIKCCIVVTIKADRACMVHLFQKDTRSEETAQTWMAERWARGWRTYNVQYLTKRFFQGSYASFCFVFQSLRKKKRRVRCFF